MTSHIPLSLACCTPRRPAGCIRPCAISRSARTRDLAGGRDPHLTRCAAQDPARWSLLSGHARTVHAHVPVAALPA